MAPIQVRHPLARPPRGERGPTMRETLAGTGALIRLGVRRDRWLLSLWILGFAVMAGSSASAGAGLFPDMDSRIEAARTDRKSTRLNSSHANISYAVFCLT